MFSVSSSRVGRAGHARHTVMSLSKRERLGDTASPQRAPCLAVPPPRGVGLLKITMKQRLLQLLLCRAFWHKRER